ncbi:hypothetical protein ACP275_14G026800 [Erythranthe tilingii]
MMIKTTIALILLLAAVVSQLPTGSPVAVSQLPTGSPAADISRRPPPENAPLFARWLVGECQWGVLNTLDRQNGFPFGNVVSYTDAATGVPYFYLSKTFDPTGPNALSNNRSSFTLSDQAELGTCSVDPQSPLAYAPKSHSPASFTCFRRTQAKLTLLNARCSERTPC